jgi:hypothetical protein
MDMITCVLVKVAARLAAVATWQPQGCHRLPASVAVVLRASL